MSDQNTQAIDAIKDVLGPAYDLLIPVAVKDNKQLGMAVVEKLIDQLQENQCDMSQEREFKVCFALPSRGKILSMLEEREDFSDIEDAVNAHLDLFYNGGHPQFFAASCKVDNVKMHFAITHTAEKNEQGLENFPLVAIGSQAFFNWDFSDIKSHFGALLNFLQAVEHVEAQTGEKFNVGIPWDEESSLGVDINRHLIMGRSYLAASVDYDMDKHAAILFHEFGHVLEGHITEGTPARKMVQALKPYGDLIRYHQQMKEVGFATQAAFWIEQSKGDEAEIDKKLAQLDAWFDQAESLLPILQHLAEFEPLGLGDPYALVDAIIEGDALTKHLEALPVNNSQDSKQLSMPEGLSFMPGTLPVDNMQLEQTCNALEALWERHKNTHYILDAARYMGQAISHALEFQADMCAVEAMGSEPIIAGLRGLKEGHAVHEKQTVLKAQLQGITPEEFDALPQPMRKQLACNTGVITPDNEHMDFDYAILEKELDLIIHINTAASSSLTHPAYNDRAEFAEDYADALKEVLAERGVNWADRFKQAPQVKAGDPASRIHQQSDSQQTR